MKTGAFSTLWAKAIEWMPFVVSLDGPNAKTRRRPKGGPRFGLVLWLIPEPTNRFDPNAIRVCATADGNYQVGYVPAARAARWAELIESPISVKGSIVGKRGKWGVKLDVDDLKAHNLRRR